MPQSIEVGRDDEQMHQVAVIGDEVVEAAAAKPARIAQRQREAAVGHRRRGFERSVDIPRVVRRFRAPPPVARRTPPPRRPRWQSPRRCDRGGERLGPGASPGGRPASRAVVATMATRPAQSRHIRPARSTPSARLIASVDFGSVGTGTASCPGPRSPETATRTCQAPAVIIQRCPVKSRGSLDDRDATSGTGANCAPGPVSGSGTMRTSRTSSLVVSTSTSATPGIACGGLIVTKILYGPA